MNFKKISSKNFHFFWSKIYFQKKNWKKSENFEIFRNFQFFDFFEKVDFFEKSTFSKKNQKINWKFSGKVEFCVFSWLWHRGSRNPIGSSTIEKIGPKKKSKKISTFSKWKKIKKKSNIFDDFFFKVYLESEENRLQPFPGDFRKLWTQGKWKRAPREVSGHWVRFIQLGLHIHYHIFRKKTIRCFDFGRFLNKISKKAMLEFQMKILHLRNFSEDEKP